MDTHWGYQKREKNFDFAKKKFQHFFLKIFRIFEFFFFRFIGFFSKNSAANKKMFLDFSISWIFRFFLFRGFFDFADFSISRIFSISLTILNIVISPKCSWIFRFHGFFDFVDFSISRIFRFRGFFDFAVLDMQQIFSGVGGGERSERSERSEPPAGGLA